MELTPYNEAYEMKMRLPIAIVVLGLMYTPVTSAHHSVSGRFDYHDEVTMTGVITRVDWLNPHIRVFLDVSGEDGAMTTWLMSAAPPAFLRRAGISKSKLLGDGTPVAVQGIRARDPELDHMWVYRITFEDGHFFQMSGPPGGE